MKIIKENALIAEFMGWEKWESEYYYDIPSGFVNHSTPLSAGLYSMDMLFNSSWDWLMPVIAKYNEVRTGYEELDGISTHLYLREAMEFNSILAAHALIIVYIKWYNNEKANHDR